MSLISRLLLILAVYLAFLPSIIVYVQPRLMEGGDYLMTFYPAGKLCLMGRIADIYTPEGMSTFIGAPFDKFIHALFPSIPAECVAIYMYSPLIALFFAPFALLPHVQSVIVYQLLNIAAVLWCAWVFRSPEPKTFWSRLFLVFLFTPVFHTLLIGQLGLLFGLVPLALACRLMWERDKERRKIKDLLAGGLLGALYLKPQFLPCAMLVVGSLFLVKRFRPALGFLAGLALMISLTCLLCGPEMFDAFIKSVKMSDTCYSFEGYKPPTHLVVCLPAVILQFFPHNLRDQVKLFAYGLSALIGLALLLDCYLKLKARGDGDQDERTISYLFLFGLLVLPLVVPHFLFYDLCALALMAWICYQPFWPSLESGKLLLWRILLYWACNIYYIVFSFAPVAALGQWLPMILVVFLTSCLLLLRRVAF